jgi:hypothetical protein
MSLQIYDDFGRAEYSLADYNQMWTTPNGLGEMAVEDTRNFGGGHLNLSAVPFRTGADVGVDDHRKYLAVSTHTFPVPRDGTLVLSSDIKASTPGTVHGLSQLGVYGPSGSWLDPANPPTPPRYTAPRLQGQQAGVVMNVLDFCTGQVFDWFIASDTAFALIERLPTVVTGNVENPDCRSATEVGITRMYTQIIREVPVRPNEWHHLDIALSRRDGDAWVDYLLDHRPIAHVEKIGIPLDKQGVSWTGIYPSIGDGELVADHLDSVRFGHGLFSLLDAFPFQHPEAPDLDVSIPVGDPSGRGAAGRARLFGQGASGSFGNFTTLTIKGQASVSEIASAVAPARS